MKNKLIILLIPISILLIFIIVNQYISRETLIDNYRFYAYHLEFIRKIDEIHINIFYALSTSILALAHTTSSFLAVHIISFLGAIFGNSRKIFVLLIALIYLIPSLLLTYWLFKKEFIKNKNVNISTNIILYLYLILNIFYWMPTLRAMPDIAGLIPFIILFYFLFNTKFYEKIKLEKLVVFGCSFFLVFILRRTFAPALLDLCVACFFFSLYEIFIQYKSKSMINIPVKIAFIFMNILIPAFIFLILIKIIMPEFSEYLFSGLMIAECNLYLGNKYENFINVLQYINPVFLIIGCYGIIKGLKNTESEKFTIFSLIYFLFYFIIFVVLQKLFFENFIQIAFIFNIYIMYGIYNIFANLENIQNNNLLSKIKKNIYTILLVLFIILNFQIFFFVNDDKIQIKNIFSNLKEESRPINPIDYPTFEKMYDFMKNEYNKNNSFTFTSFTDLRLFDPETIIYFSFLNNDKIFSMNVINAVAPNTFGLSLDSYNADFVVTINPWGKQNNNENIFLPISIPNSDFIKGEGISKYYKMVKEIPLIEDENYKIYIWKKVKPIPYSEMEIIAQKFIEKAPEYSEHVNNQLKEYRNKNK